VTFGLDSSLGTPYWCAVKTGTSKDMRDNWSVGFSSGFTVAVWVGNFEGDAMRSVSGVTGAAPAWREIMDGLQATRASSAPIAPAGVQSIPVRFSGRTEPARVEWFLDGTAPRGTVASVRAESRIAHISNPANGMVIAVDPDIPADLQRIPFTVQGAVTELLLRLNDQAIGRVEGSYLWQPTRGVHRLALEDQTGRVIDRILFTVR
jgi:penicillin-binding protein 1C